MNIKLLHKCKKIKIVLTDVDGVLTDGGMYYTENGNVMKKFHVRDGMGVTLLRKKGIPTIIISKEKNVIVKKWATNMHIKKLYQGIVQKELILENICKTFKVSSSEIAYIGDDVNDTTLLEHVGLLATPSDGVKEAKDVSDYICNRSGGDGAFREFAELILRSKLKSRKIEYTPS